MGAVKRTAETDRGASRDVPAGSAPPPSSHEQRAPLPQTQRAPARGKYDRSRSADERQREQLDRLLDAAIIVFAERGWAEASVEAIVTRAGMSRRTFYEHFEDLRECLLRVHERMSKRAFLLIESAVSAETDPHAMLRAGVEGLMLGIATFPDAARVMFRVVRSAGPEFEAVHDEMMSRFAELVSNGVKKAHEMGAVSQAPDEIRVFALVSAMEAVAMRYVLRGTEAKAVEAAPALIDMVERTFK